MAASETSEQGLDAGQDLEADPLKARSAPAGQPAPGELDGSAQPDGELARPVGPDELNAWRRGFTPQAEIWNGRLAMLGLSMGIAALLLIRLFTQP